METTGLNSTATLKESRLSCRQPQVRTSQSKKDEAHELVEVQSRAAGWKEGIPLLWVACSDCSPHTTRNEGSLSHTSHSCFRYSLALFAESFAPIDHSTCALSVLCPYFTLCGAPHTVQSSIPRRPTHLYTEDTKQGENPATPSGL